MPKVRTIVPRYKRNTGKRADIMTFNIERFRDGPKGEKERFLESITVTPQGTEVSQGDADFMLSTSQRIELVEEINFSRMNKDSLLAHMVQRNITIPAKVTNKSLVALLEAHVENNSGDDSQTATVPDGPPDDDDDDDSGAGGSPGGDD